MKRYWVETVDEELNALGQLAVDTPHILGLDIQSDSQRVDVVLATGTPPPVVARVDAALQAAMGPRLTAGRRWSGHSVADLEAARKYVLEGDWARFEPTDGPMSVSFSPALDRLEVHLPSSAAKSAARLRAALPAVVHVVLDDGMMRR